MLNLEEEEKQREFRSKLVEPKVVKSHPSLFLEKLLKNQNFNSATHSYECL